MSKGLEVLHIDISQTHVYQNYKSGLVKIYNGTDWEEVAHWDSVVSKMIFAKDDASSETTWRALMR